MKKVKISGQSFELEKGKESLEFIKRPGNITLLRYTDPVTHAIVQKRFYYQQSGNTFSAHFDQHSVLGEWSLKKRTEGTDSNEDIESAFVTQFPGKVRKILINAPLKVKKDDPIILLEAMKMEFPIKAPCDGEVKKILIKEGEQLEPGKKLIEFEQSQVKNEKK